MPVLTTKFQLIDDMSERLMNLGTTAQNVQEELEKIGTAANSMNMVSESSESAEYSLNTFTAAITESNEAEQQYSLSLNNCSSALEVADGAFEDVQDATEKTSQQLSGLTESLGETEQAYSETSDEAENYEKSTQEVMNSLNQLVATTGVVVFLKGIYNGFEECIDSASEFETAVAKVSTIADTEVMSIEQIGNDMFELSQKTGVAAAALSEAEYQALSAGVATDKAAQFVEQANELAVGGFTQTATAVDVLTTALNAYNLDVSETSRVSDVLIQIQNLGKTTVDELASSMGRVIPAASAYNVEIEDLGAAYATLTANGIATSETTTYLKSVLNELSDTGSTVATILGENTGKTFSELESEGKSLGDVMAILGEYVDNDSTAFGNLWSSSEAGMAALSLLNTGTEKYNQTLGQMQSATGSAAAAYETMTDTAEHSSQALTTATTNLNTAIGSVLLPTTTKLNQNLAGTINGLASFVNENPAVVKAVTAGTVGLTAATAAVTLYSFKTEIATAATVAFEAAQTALSGPVGIVIGLIGVGTAALAAWTMSEDEAAQNAEQLTSASQAQADAVDEARVKYEEAAQQYGENYAITEQYKAELDELTASYEQNKTTLGDLITNNEELARKYQELQDNDESQKINNQANATKALVDRLFELGEQTQRTADEKAEMLTIIEDLNEEFPELSLNYDDIISKTAKTKDAVMALVDQEYQSEKLQTAKNNYKEYKALLEEQKAAVEEYESELKDPYEKYLSSDGNIQAQAEWESFWNKQIEVTTESGETITKTWSEAYNESTDRLKELQADVDEFSDEIASLSGVVDDSALSQLSSAELAQTAIDGVQSEIDALVASYDEAYQAALNSIEGQYELWDKAVDVAAEDFPTTTDTIMSNLDSQIAYWKTYSDNLESLQNRNIDGLNELIASMDDGSEESAAALAGMATASDSELQKMVEKYGTLQDEQGRTAESMDGLKNDFEEKMQAIENKATTTIDNMELSDDASAAAKATITAYVTEIENGIGAATSAAQAVKNAVASVLSSTSTSTSYIPGTSIAEPQNAYASGTLNAEPGLALVGEEGPELINFGGGEVVYTTDETKQLLNPNFNVPDPYAAISSSGKTLSDNPLSESTSKDVNVTIQFADGTAIKLGGNGGIDTELFAELLTEQLKPALINIVKEEVYEEGDDSYDY
jgi:TP901 family phage tail tape measure protein